VKRPKIETEILSLPRSGSISSMRAGEIEKRSVGDFDFFAHLVLYLGTSLPSASQPGQDAVDFRILERCGVFPPANPMTPSAR
jgi:hypothetical protein